MSKSSPPVVGMMMSKPRGFRPTEIGLSKPKKDFDLRSLDSRLRGNDNLSISEDIDDELMSKPKKDFDLRRLGCRNLRRISTYEELNC